MRFYEMAVIADPELVDEGYQALIDKLDKLLKKKRKKTEKGEFVRIDDWGVRRLAYPIAKKAKGRYTFLTMKCLPDTLAELERNLHLMDEVMRFQTIKLKTEPQFEETAVREEAPAEKSKPADKPEPEAKVEAGRESVEEGDQGEAI